MCLTAALTATGSSGLVRSEAALPVYAGAVSRVITCVNPVSPSGLYRWFGEEWGKLHYGCLPAHVHPQLSPCTKLTDDGLMMTATGEEMSCGQQQ